MTKNKKYLVTVILPWHQKQSYILSKKLTQAIIYDNRVNNLNSIELLYNAYITVPVSKYTKHGNALMAIGKIVKIRRTPWKKSLLKMAYTRSQFIIHENMIKENYQTNFNYLKHDYTNFNDWLIKINIKYWSYKNEKQKIVHRKILDRYV